MSTTFPAWLANALTVHSARVLIDQLLDIVGPVVAAKRDSIPRFRKDMREERICSAIQLRSGNDAVSDFVMFISAYSMAAIPELTLNPSTPPSRRCDAFFKYRVGRVADSGIDVPLHLEVEQRGAVLGALELERDRLVNGDCYAFVADRLPNLRELRWSPFS